MGVALGWADSLWSPPLARPIRPLVLSSLLLALLTGPLAAQVGGDDSLERALLDILRDKGLIDAAQYDELLALARQRVDARARDVTLIEASLQRLAAPDVQARGGTPGKLVFRSPDGTWSLGLRGQIQARAEDVESDDDTMSAVNFSVPRARLTVEGNAGARNAMYKLTVDIPTNKKIVDPATDSAVNLRDGYVDWGFGWGDAFRLGQFKFPFGREMLTSSSVTQFQERSIASEEFSPNFEPGAMYWGQAADGTLEYQAAISNGEGRSRNNTAGEEQNGLREGVRVVWNPLGAVKLDGPAFQTVDDGSTRVALGAALMHAEDSTGLATATENGESTSRAFELNVYSGPFSFLAEYFTRDAHVDGGDDADDAGHTLQAGWFLVPKRWELVARAASIHIDLEDDAEERAIGLNWYLDKHNGKWLLDISELDNEGATADASRVRLQYQVLF